MTRTGTTASGFVWSPVRWNVPPGHALSSARFGRDETRECPPQADIQLKAEKACGGTMQRLGCDFGRIR